jgi:hypothetical protein
MDARQKAVAKFLMDAEQANMATFENLNYNDFENLSTSDLKAMAGNSDFMKSLSPTLQSAIRSGNANNLAKLIGSGGGGGKPGILVRGYTGDKMVNATFDINISAPIIVTGTNYPAVPNNIFNIPIFGAGVSKSNYVTNTLPILNVVIDTSGNVWIGKALPGYLVAGGDPSLWYITYSATNANGTTTITWTIGMSFYSYVALVEDLRNNILKIDNHRITLNNPNNLLQYQYPYYPSNQSPMGKFGGSAVTLRSYKPPTDYASYIMDFKTAEPWKVTQQDYIIMGFNPNSSLGSPNSVNIAFDVETFDRSGKD